MVSTMEKANIDWANLGFGYYKTEKRYVSNYKDGKWDEGHITSDENIVLNESAGVLQYAQTCFEGMKAYPHKDGGITIFRPDRNARRFADSMRGLGTPAVLRPLTVMDFTLTAAAEEAGATFSVRVSVALTMPLRVALVLSVLSVRVPLPVLAMVRSAAVEAVAWVALTVIT